MSSSATGVGMTICFLGAILLILTQKSSQKFGDVLGIMSMMAGKKVGKETAVLIYDSIHKNKVLVMEAIRQNGKIILHSDEGTSIRMIFKNLTGRNFQGQEYADYIRYIAIGTWDFRPASSSIAGTVR
ncbi:DUF7688 family protein [Paraprevotella clara]|uniref:DUF7688 family protein n=2 Tax=Bacteroidia TaxID=200643 RepID=UPI003D75BC52